MRDRRPIPGSWGRGYRTDWRRLRAAVLSEQPYCVLCDMPATTVDHILPRRVGGTDERINLQPLCAPCHSRKTARMDGGYGRKPRAAKPHTGRATVSTLVSDWTL